MSSATTVQSEVSMVSTCGLNKKEMFETFQTWALSNYGDSGKTKTVTRKKYKRIVKILNGEEASTAENSKFRFWVKAKGFRLGSPGVPHENNERNIVYVPTKQVTDSNSNAMDREYKRVAIVEDFFDIIYGIHVEMDGRGGKHAGQKRTYRAIAETYAFLPREAVTRFLMSCSDCQKRMHMGVDNNNANADGVYSNAVTNGNERDVDDPPIIDFSVPITQTYLNHMRQRGFLQPKDGFDEESMSSVDSAGSREQSPSPSSTDDGNNLSTTPKQDGPAENGGSLGPVNLSTVPFVRSTDSPIERDRSPLLNFSKSPNSREDRGHPERKRRASEDSCESSSKMSECGNLEDSVGGKDDDDEDDNDDDDKLPAGQDIDPERLKAFNMFVRLFVDENLDRMVPISKQPKDKIQAILEACDRQFPEFHIRSRKRIRTYLKSCRRMRRSKEQNGWESLRPTPPHLTSAAAESLLAQACENESQNAKRMRMGLDPLPAACMSSSTTTVTVSQSQASTVTPTSQPTKQSTPSPKPQPTSSQTSPQSQSSTVPQVDRHAPSSNDFLRHQPPPPAFRPPPEFHPNFFTNGNGLFRPGFPSGYQHPAHHHPPVLSHSPMAPSSVQNGKLCPTDLSIKKQSSKNQLSTSEVATIKQLIGGYRESAAFLYRSADELEQLLLQQN
ncbi:hypothetical protein FSP39_023561 [Pinctada imbricata]|uniref:Nucleolar protein 4 helical domain-containing protein n=1 Tax=Pinctada imbricata TaxID=66713 RepID=A0AA89BS00_PINIB|nr:hypothetical protein FSP39_023561 [Pinctada imbricata]